MSGLFDRIGDHALMFGAGTGGAARYDLATIRNQTVAIFRQRHLFVVDAGHLFDAEHTDFASGFTKLIGLATRRTGSRATSRHRDFLSFENGTHNQRYRYRNFLFFRYSFALS